MNRNQLTIAISAIIFGLVFNYFGMKKGWSWSAPAFLHHIEIKKSKSNRIQVALLLDTSGSMSGLIEQAKSQLWQILNQLSRARRDGEVPQLEIALYEYGNTQRMTGIHQIVKITDFTRDMDLISEKLFALTTSGGDEFCGQVIRHSLDQLEWTNNDNDIRLIYIAGNESFYQGPVNAKKSCLDALSRDISVNTIFCGNYQEGIRTGWRIDVSELGTYMNIDHNEATTYITTPYDDQINQLNSELNGTYIPFGQEGGLKLENQARQDANATQYSKSNMADRAAYKSSKNYRAESWDLVDAYQKDKRILKKAKNLPEDMKGLGIEEMEKRIEAAGAKRKMIQDQIRELNKKRQDFQLEADKNSPEKDDLRKSVLESVLKQASKKGYEMED